MLPKVQIIILNWNSWPDTVSCLESVEKLTYPSYEVTLVDNGSVDNSVTRLCEWVRGRPEKWGEVRDLQQAPSLHRTIFGGSEIILKTNKLTLIRLAENLGFTGACNFASELTLADPAVAYLYFLNNDARLSPKALEEIVYVAQDMHADLVGSTIWESQNSGPTFAGSNIFIELFWPTPARALFVLKARRADRVVIASMVPGSAMLISRQLVELRHVELGYLFWPIFLPLC